MMTKSYSWKIFYDGQISSLKHNIRILQMQLKSVKEQRKKCKH